MITSHFKQLILRQWSADLDCPIFAVDYSLAPEAPFPAAFEECFYAYVWALKNSHFLGKFCLQKVTVNYMRNYLLNSIVMHFAQPAFVSRLL